MAEREFSAAIALHDNATWRCERAYALTTMNRNMDAFADVQSALVLNPQEEYCRELGSNIAAGLARSAKSASDAEEGMRMLNLLIDQGFGNADAFNQRGYRHQEQGKLDLAYADYLASAKLDDGWGQLMTGKCLWAGRGTPENREEAMAWLKKAADKGDRDAVVSYQQAQDMLRTAKK